MEPKFQSSFIPKGPNASSTRIVAIQKKDKSLLGFLSLVIFTISVVLGAGMFGYKFYLKYRIEQMGADLQAARATLAADDIEEIIRLDNRIVSTRNLVSNHRILTPLLDYLENSTLRGVRFIDFGYEVTPEGITLDMTGEASGYSALALQDDIFSKSEYFSNPRFSNLELNERGNVTFIFEANINPTLVSYQSELDRSGVLTAPVTLPVGTSTAATTTPN